jgi:hypothetical protein
MSEQTIESSALLALKLRNAIASKEWITAAANVEVAKYGEWQCDWYTAMREAENEITALLHSANNCIGDSGKEGGAQC